MLILVPLNTRASFEHYKDMMPVHGRDDVLHAVANKQSPALQNAKQRIRCDTRHGYRHDLFGKRLVPNDECFRTPTRIVLVMLRYVLRRKPRTTSGRAAELYQI